VITLLHILDYKTEAVVVVDINPKVLLLLPVTAEDHQEEDLPMRVVSDRIHLLQQLQYGESPLMI
jgi:hypothetical protein